MTPGLSWDALLKKADIVLELLTDLDMFLFIERGMRGISMARKHYAKANNPRVADYDPSKPNKFITYLDANNPYGWAMSLPLPKGRIQVEVSDAHQRENHEVERKLEDQLDLGGGLGVTGRTPQVTQQSSAGG